VKNEDERWKEYVRSQGKLLYILVGAFLFGVFGTIAGEIAMTFVFHFYPAFGDAYMKLPELTGFAIAGAPGCVAFVAGLFWLMKRAKTKWP
jgi:hypothetical protein